MDLSKDLKHKGSKDRIYKGIQPYSRWLAMECIRADQPEVWLVIIIHENQNPCWIVAYNENTNGFKELENLYRESGMKNITAHCIRLDSVQQMFATLVQ